MLETRRWWADAACRDVDTAIFFVDDELGPVLELGPAQAGWWCARCPVRETCLEYALRLRLEHGIFGGTSARERRGMMRKRRRVARLTRPA